MVLILAFVVTVVVTPLAMVLARRFDVLDRPGDLKVQSTAVPYFGGLGVAAGLAVGVVPVHPSLLLPLGLALVLGLVDDVRTIGAVIRLSAEVAVGLGAAAVLPVRIAGPLGVVAAVVVVALLVNGVNMIDGLDALASGVAFMSALGFALVLDGDGRAVALALAGGLAGFLVFNRPPAKVYLGDGGAYLVGTALAVLLGMAWSQDRSWAVALGSLPLVACPVAELGFAVQRRFRSGTHLFTGDRSHIYDQLVATGWSPKGAVLAYVGTQMMLCAIAVGAVHLSPAVAGAVAGGCGVALLVLAGALGFLTPTYPETAT